MLHWSVTDMANTHHCISVVYRDTTQADYESSEAIGFSQSLPRSSGSFSLESGESFFDDGRKPASFSTTTDIHAQDSLKLDDVFLFEIPGMNVAVPSVGNELEHQPADSSELQLVQLGKCNSLESLTNSRKCSVTETMQDLGIPDADDLPVPVTSMWDENFQDLTELIQEDSREVSGSAASELKVIDVLPQESEPSTSGIVWMTDNPLKRTYDLSSSDGFSDSETKVGRMEIPARYAEIRIKNNQASRKSRMTRKEKEREMEDRARQLEQDNQVLRIKVKNLEELTNKLKKHLIDSIVNKR